VARGRSAGATTPPPQAIGCLHRATDPDGDRTEYWCGPSTSNSDATTNGRPIKIASIVDEHTQECLGGLVARSITGDVLIDELDRIAISRGYPQVLRSDSGPELACAAMADWVAERVGLAFIPPGQQRRNVYIESFNGRLRDECLNINAFWSLTHAKVVITDWKDEYNHHRRHSALAYQTPAGYAAGCTHQQPLSQTAA
jgi:putative transposase